MKRNVWLLSGVALLTLVTFASCKGERSLEEKLKSIEGVSNVTAFEPKTKVEGIKSYYTFDIKQSLDWDNPSAASFNQRACIYYVSDTAPTEYYVNGYSIYEGEPASYLALDEFYSRYQCNIVHIEYRFFNHSKPTDFDPKGTKYYQYMNSYQASKDFHHVITSMKSFLTGSTIFSGGSKGGYTTEAMAYYYPNDIDSYVSYVAPLCNSDYDTRFAEYVYTKIGDTGFPTGKGAEYRGYVADFQRRALDDKFRNKVMEHIFKRDLSSASPLTYDEVYESVVFNFAVGMWQYHTDFGAIKEINDMPETTEEEIAQKAYAIAVRMDPSIAKKSNEEESSTIPYYVQAKTEMGNYLVDLDYLRNAGMNVKTAKERDKVITDYSCLTPEQTDTFKYSDKFRNELINFLNTTDKEIVKIVGLNDPWYGVKDPVTENKHIHLFEVNNNHYSRIRELDETKQKEVWSIIDQLLGIKK